MASNSLDINNTALGNASNVVKDYSVTPVILDSPNGAEETTYQNFNAPKQYGYFTSNADLKSAIIAKAIWVVGKGYTANPETQVILEHITGWGKDTFDDILFNIELNRRIHGDAFAEIIMQDGILVNLKVLNSANMRIVTNKKGIIIRYEQLDGQKITKFKPEEIFHLSNNRFGDQIHGISDIDSVEDTLLAEMESFKDMKKIMHRQAKPLIMFKLGTDDPTKIAAFAVKMDNATNVGDNMYVPDDANAVSYEVVQVTPSPLVLNWRDDIRKKFYRAIGLPELLPSGGGDSTESGGKIGYLVFEQIIEREQRYYEQQILSQLNLKINLIPPASLAENLQADNAKDGANGQMGFQPSDVMAGVGR